MFGRFLKIVFVLFAFFFFASTSHADTFVSGPISSDTIWTFASSTYVVQGLVTINPGVTLTIEPGVVIKFDVFSQIIINGNLNANGTPTDKIYFTSLKDDTVGGDTNADGNATFPAPQDWIHIQFNSGSNGNITNAVIRYAGKVWCSYDCFGSWGGIYNNGGSLNISNSQIDHNYSYGISQNSGTTTVIATDFGNHLYGFFLGNGTASISESNFHDNALGYYGYGVYANDGNLNLINNTFTNNLSASGLINASVNFIHSGNTASGTGLRGFVMAGIINTDSTWNADLPYIISSYPVTVESTKTLTIEPGVVVKFDQFYSLVVNGNLNANGASDSKIYFTSLRDDSVGGDTDGDVDIPTPAPQDWTHIQFNSGSSGDLNNAVVRYAGWAWCAMNCFGSWGGIYNNGGTLSISNSKILDNNRYGIYQNSGSLTLLNSEIKNNSYGAYFSAGTANLSQNSFHDNSDYAVFNSSPTLVSAQNNWWGSDSGPYHLTLNPSGTGNRVSDNVNFIPWLGYDPEKNQPLSTKAAVLAKQVVNHPEAYLLGGKGWDYNLKEFVAPTNLLSGYTYKKNATGIGVDCSGLIMWAYDRSFDKDKPASDNFVRALNADEQYRYNTISVEELNLQPGDVIFFDFTSSDGPNRIDHTAMYVGESGGYDVVSAAGKQRGIVSASKDSMRNWDEFRAFRRVSTSTPLAMKITSYSPVDLVITDPNGFTITATTTIPSDEEYIREIPGVLYYSEMEQGEDGNPIDRVYSYTEKTGDYKIQVIPNSDTSQNATYSLDFEKGDQTIILAQGIPINQIPSGGYDVRVNQDDTISLIQTLTSSADTYVKLENPNKNQGTETKLNLQYLDAHRLLVQFDQEEIRSAIPVDKNIVSAKLKFTITKNGNMWGKNGNTIGTYRMIKPWTELGATWLCANDTNTSNSRPDCPGGLWGMAGFTNLRLYATSTTDTEIITNNQSGIVSFDVTNDVKNFLSGQAQNYGWLIKKTNLLSTGWIEFGSKESVNPPKLIIETE